MKRRTDLLEEQNGLQAFAASECDTEQDKQDRAEFLKLTRKAHLQRPRASISEDVYSHDQIQMTPSPPSIPDTQQYSKNNKISPPSPPQLPPLPPNFD